MDGRDKQGRHYTERPGQRFGDSRLPTDFWRRVAPAYSGCWLWTGSLNPSGYGNCYTRELGRTSVAHRVAYSATVAAVPDGWQVDHLCRVRACVNPAHLEAVTPSENTLRGRVVEAMRARKAAMTHCEAGHPLSGDNLYINKTSGQRVCRECRRRYDRARRARERDAEKSGAVNGPG